MFAWPRGSWPRVIHHAAAIETTTRREIIHRKGLALFESRMGYHFWNICFCLRAFTLWMEFRARPTNFVLMNSIFQVYPRAWTKLFSSRPFKIFYWYQFLWIKKKYRFKFIRGDQSLNPLGKGSSHSPFPTALNINWAYPSSSSLSPRMHWKTDFLELCIYWFPVAAASERPVRSRLLDIAGGTAHIPGHTHVLPVSPPKVKLALALNFTIAPALRESNFARWNLLINPRVDNYAELRIYSR